MVRRVGRVRLKPNDPTIGVAEQELLDRVADSGGGVCWNDVHGLEQMAAVRLVESGKLELTSRNRRSWLELPAESGSETHP